MVVEKFKESREERDLKQKNIAEIFEVHFSTVSGWETGKDTIPINRLIDYANIYDFSLDYLFGLIPRNADYDPIKVDIKVLARNLKRLRRDNDYTQGELASKLNTSQSEVSNWENGLYIIPTSFLYALTLVYDSFSIDELFGRKKRDKRRSLY